MLSAFVNWSKTLFSTSHKQEELYKQWLDDNDVDAGDYKKLRELTEKKRLDLVSSPTRFQSINERYDRSDFPAEAYVSVTTGKYLTRYRGFDICKCPQDLVLYHQMFEMIKPKTIIELGTLSGGMAVWMADTLKLLEINCNVFSIDNDPANLSEVVEKVKPENVTFLVGDAFAIGETLTPEFLSKLEHPWIFVEDAHANVAEVLRYLHQHCLEGDYMVVEDTSPVAPKEYGMGSVVPYSAWGRSKLDCLRHFLKEYEDYYAVDSFFTDMFSYNGSFHWHGFIRKMK